MNYVLMHRDIAVAEIELDDLSHISNVIEIIDERHLPVGTVRNGIFDKHLLQRWWANRSIPASRSGIREVLHGLGFAVPQELLVKCFGLSLSDQYWI